jgi:acyl dehydratase
MLETRLVDLPLHRGAELGTTAWLTIGQDRIDSFAETTEDRQWIHTDLARAAAGPFGTTIAHGYLTLSLVSGFLLDLLVITDAGSALNYGLDRVRFPSPVPSGSDVRGSGKLLDVKALDGGGVQATSRVTVHTAGGAKPAVVADVVTRFLP